MNRTNGINHLRNYLRNRPLLETPITQVITQVSDLRNPDYAGAAQAAQMGVQPLVPNSSGLRSPLRRHDLRRVLGVLPAQARRYVVAGRLRSPWIGHS